MSNFVDKLKTVLTTGTAVASILLTTQAHASGELDFLDDCIGVREDVKDHHKELASLLAAEEGKIGEVEFSPEFETYWLKSNKEALRVLYYEALGNAGMVASDEQKGVLFDVWYENTATEELKAEIQSSFEATQRAVLDEDRVAVNKIVDEDKDALDKNCKMDFGNQALRASLKIVLAPVDLVGRNFELSKNEKTALSKATMATTGISTDDIAKHGLLGGSGSDARKVANKIAGGKNSEVRKGLRALDPGNW